MSDMFSTLGTWNWLIFGFVLMALELIAPGVFLFWLGLAALLVGLVSFALHPSWQAQLLMFAVFAAAAVPAVAAVGAGKQRGERQQSVPQQAYGRAGRPGVHAGKADHRRLRHGTDRRHHLARRRSRCAGRQPRPDRAGGWCQSHGSGGVSVASIRELSSPHPALRGERSDYIADAIRVRGSLHEHSPWIEPLTPPSARESAGREGL